MQLQNVGPTNVHFTRLVGNPAKMNQKRMNSYDRPMLGPTNEQRHQGFAIQHDASQSYGYVIASSKRLIELWLRKIEVGTLWQPKS
jgi:hypothetical protein